MQDLIDFRAMMEQQGDLSEIFSEKVRAAVAAKISLNIQGSGSKSFYGRPAQGEPLLISGHHGIINYDQTELVITARCGTRLANIEAVLAEHGQMLPFEPPHFGPQATLGGAIATGLSGPRRPYAGAARDVVLGVRLLNGRGEILKFGGEVIKNVAGFDVARLMVGALGTLGMLLEISMRVLPRPQHEATLLFQLPPDVGLRQMNRWAGQNWPLSGACYDGENLRVRLSGAEAAISEARKKMGGEVLSSAEAATFWHDLREQRLAFFQGEMPLWRLSMAPAAGRASLPGFWLIDWGGALRWLKTEAEPAVIFREAQLSGGHACRFRSLLGGEFQPLPTGLENLHRKLKQAFDPHGVFNLGRLYAGW